MKRALIFLLLCLFPVLVHADTTYPTNTQGRQASWDVSGLLSSVALNGAAGTRTFTLPARSLKGFTSITLWMTYVFANAGTISTACTSGPGIPGKNLATDYSLTTCTWVGGTCTLSFNTNYITASLSASAKWSIVMDVTGSGDLVCVVTHGGTPSASDKISVDAVLLAK